MADFFLLLHPKVVHFPIALFVSAVGMEGLALVFRKESFRNTAWQIYVLATLLTPWVVWSGWEEAERLHLSHPVLSLHRNLAFAVCGISWGSLPFLLWAKKRGEKIFGVAFPICVLALAVLVSMTAHQGGRMVYEYGVGVQN